MRCLWDVCICEMSVGCLWKCLWDVCEMSVGMSVRCL